MSIGKNAIKRVENNGYSKVKTTAPDMVNSTVIGATDKQVLDMVEKSVNKKPATKKATQTKKAPVKKVEKVEVVAPVVTVPEEVKKPTVKAVKKPIKAEKNENGKSYSFGDDLPIYLL
ncbi:MAG: hypothetical protein J6V66_02290 [Clostridia bacterium]|nr:hypothetical protein [Clostridia bacterium]